MTPAIKINNLTYSYRRQLDRPALQEVTLEIATGEFVAIAGRAGSGKSTLCYALNGLIPHSFGGRMNGDVVVCGLNTRLTPVPHLARHIGLVLQNAESQLVGLTVEEDAAFGLENTGLPREEVAQRVHAALQVMGLEKVLHRSPWTLSGGQKQRLSIAAAIALQPQVLVLDNPTAELDPMGKKEVMAALARLNSDLGMTVVIVNQEIEEILPYAARLILMDAGRIVRAGNLVEVIDSIDMRRAGVKLPEVAQAADELRKKGCWEGRLPLTVDEAAKKLVGVSPLWKSAAHHRAPSDAPGEPIIQMENISFSYPDGNPVFSGVTLTVKRGEFVTLMGPNGAGKTTLAKHMNGLLIPTSGRVLIRGVDTRTSRVARLAKTVGYVFQNPDHQLFCRTAAEELAFGPRNLGWSKAEVDKAVEQGLDHIGGQIRGKEDPFFMGLAERKLVAIASILTMGPDVLVLDEPATGADHDAALRIMHYLSELHRQGLTIIIVTHDVSLAANYADRIVVLHSGSVALDGAPNEIFQRHEQLTACSVAPPAIAALAQELHLSPFTCLVDEFVEGFAGTT